MVDLGDKGKLTSGAICGLDGGVWAKSANFPPATVEQLVYLISGYTGEQQFAQLQAQSPVLGDIKFFIIDSDLENGIIRGKCNNGGFCVKRTNQCVVIGIHMTPMAPADGNQVVENLANYLIDNNY